MRCNFDAGETLLSFSFMCYNLEGVPNVGSDEFNRFIVCIIRIKYRTDVAISAEIMKDVGRRICGFEIDAINFKQA